MNEKQRMWLVIALIFFGALLVLYGVEWTFGTTGRRGIALVSASKQWSQYTHGSVFPGCSAEPDYCSKGLFFRSDWALIWGGLLPLLLFALAVYLALGRRSTKQHDH
jgi:hypothetical protein